jgi:hypothetical protein
MTMRHDLRFAGIALAAAAIALSAAPARAEYMQMTLRSAKITSYGVNGSGLDDLPAPPPKVAAAPKKPQPALNGYANLTLNGTQLKSAPNGGKHEGYDFPGGYAQRFDGVDKGGKNGPITVYGYDMTHRLHRGRQASSAQRR